MYHSKVFKLKTCLPQIADVQNKYKQDGSISGKYVKSFTNITEITFIAKFNGAAGS